MAYNGEFKAVTMATSSDMRTRQFHIVEMATSAIAICDFASAGNGYGVVVNNPNTGEAASVAVDGEVRVKCGSGGITIGDRITSAASGWATKAMSGAAGPMKILGIAKVTAASGSLSTVEFMRYTIPASSSVTVGGV